MQFIDEKNFPQQIFFLLSGTYIAAAPPLIIGGDKCSWGPSYWCESLENARECKMTVKYEREI